MRRLRGELRVGQAGPGQQVVQVRAILRDLSATGVGLFTSQKLYAGQQAELVLEAMPSTVLKGTVVWCHEMGMGTHVLSPIPYLWRAGFLFTFQTPEEEAAAKNLYAELSKPQG